MTKRKASSYEIATGDYKRYKDRTWSEWGLRTAAVASGAELGFLTAELPGAVNGAVYAGRAFDYIAHGGELDSFESTDLKEPLPQTKTMGKYVGYLKNATKKRDDVYVKAGRTGGLHDQETFGLVTDPNCVYIHHSTYSFNAISFAVRFALIRKVFHLAGIPVVNRFEELPLQTPTNSIGFRIEYLHYNPLTGVQTTVGYNTVDNETLTDVTNSFVGFDTALEQYMGGAFPNQEPLKLLLYRADLHATTDFRLAAQLNISDEEMHLNCYSNIKVQNRTVGDAAVAGDRATDRTDSQPVVCTLYHFNNADPRLRSSTNYGSTVNVLSGCSPDTIKLLRAGSVAAPLSFGALNEFQNAPPKSIFQNCPRLSKTVIQPGEIREAIVSYAIVGRGLAFFKKLTFEGTNAGVTTVSGVLGRSQMLVFEEKMRTVGTNPVSIHYERKHKTACYSITRKSGFIQPHLQIIETNLP